MGFTPAQTGAMSVWEFLACADAHAAAKGGGSGEAEPMSLSRMRELGVA